MPGQAVRPQHPVLRTYIEYFFFHQQNQEAGNVVQTSFANTNVCLGIVREKSVQFHTDGPAGYVADTDISTYLTGLYMTPLQLHNQGALEEICINFSCLGYYRFFRAPLPELHMQTDFLRSCFGPTAHYAMQAVFACADLTHRQALLENFLLRHLQSFEHPLLEKCLRCLVQAEAVDWTVNLLNQHLGTKPKQLYRLFKTYLGVTPKAYLRMHRFRTSLAIAQRHPNASLTEIGLRSGYYDQSHFIRDYHFFTHSRPGRLFAELVHIDQLLLVKEQPTAGVAP